MRVAENSDYESIVAFLKKHINDSLYMYIDIAKYGLELPSMKVWVNEGSPVKMVVMKYHTSLSVCADDDGWDREAVLELVRQEKPLSMTADEKWIKDIFDDIQDDYTVEYGHMFSFDKYRDIHMDVEVETAKEEDMLEAAALIKTDEGIGSYYETQDLADQLIERMNTQMGRSYIIRENGKIIAHIASYAEYDGLATTGGLIVDADHRDTVYGAFLEKYLVDRLHEDGFKVYTFVTGRMRYRFLKAMGNEVAGKYGKLMIK